ncbi:hypothetical protein CSC03_4861 [Enterobacter hormaechei]|uniref:Uncharacterized protein n=1 Tax=Citrobacter freundii TaxID=546 RepID=A0A0G3B6D1_CITFR|nr:hypothetical protein [Citrobacter freundii]PRW32404.1 hypothetical protein CSC03_4861 [Enterobacter hormaechei]QGW60169.1 hypothetical protein [Citrobacter freundii]
MHRCRLTADLEIAAQNTDAQTCFLNVSDIWPGLKADAVVAACRAIRASNPYCPETR